MQNLTFTKVMESLKLEERPVLLRNANIETHYDCGAKTISEVERIILIKRKVATRLTNYGPKTLQKQQRSEI